LLGAVLLGFACDMAILHSVSGLDFLHFPCSLQARNEHSRFARNAAGNGRCD